MVDNIWVIGSHYNVFWRTKPNIYIIYTLAFWSYWYQAIIPHSFRYSTYYLRLRSPIDMDYHLMSNYIYLPVCQSNLASTILALLLTVLAEWSSLSPVVKLYLSFSVVFTGVVNSASTEEEPHVIVNVVPANSRTLRCVQVKEFVENLHILIAKCMKI